MKLAHPMFDFPLEVYSGRPVVLTIENTRFRRKFIQLLLNQSEGDNGPFALFSDDDDPLVLSKHLQVITDIYHLDFNSKVLQKRFDALLSATMNEELFEETQTLQKALTQYIFDLTERLPYPTECKTDSASDVILKGVAIKPFVDLIDLKTGMIDYLVIFNDLLPNFISVIVGVGELFNDEELNIIIHEIQNKDLRVLFLESKQRDVWKECCSEVVVDDGLSFLR